MHRAAGRLGRGKLKNAADVIYWVNRHKWRDRA